MKPCSKIRRDKSTCANIFLELTLTIWFRHYLGKNAISCYWSYIDFFTLITYNYMLTDTYNSDWAAVAEFISSHRRYSKNVCKFHRKAPALESFFYKVASLQAFNVTKKDSYTGFFPWNLRNSEEHLFWRTSERLLLCIDYFIIYWFLQYTFFIFTNKLFFITQLKLELMTRGRFPLKKYFTERSF